MNLVLPTQSDEKAHAELVAIREAGERIAASPGRRRAFLAALGFGQKKKTTSAPKPKRVSMSIKRGA